MRSRMFHVFWGLFSPNSSLAHIPLCVAVLWLVDPLAHWIFIYDSDRPTLPVQLELSTVLLSDNVSDSYRWQLLSLVTSRRMRQCLTRHTGKLLHPKTSHVTASKHSSLARDLSCCHVLVVLWPSSHSEHCLTPTITGMYANLTICIFINPTSFWGWGILISKVRLDPQGLQHRQKVSHPLGDKTSKRVGLSKV